MLCTVEHEDKIRLKTRRGDGKHTAITQTLKTRIITKMYAAESCQKMRQGFTHDAHGGFSKRSQIEVVQLPERNYTAVLRMPRDCLRSAWWASAPSLLGLGPGLDFRARFRARAASGLGSGSGSGSGLG